MTQKTKSFLTFLIKILIVIAALYFIYNQLTKTQIEWNKISLFCNKKNALIDFVLILSLSFLNRYLEILKWQNLVSTIKKISFKEASKQVLASLTAGIFTPNGVGEYAGKTLFYKKNQAQEIVFLNLICNGIQMILTLIFGTISLYFLGFKFWTLYVVLALCFISLIFFSLKEIKIKNYSIKKGIEKILEIPKSVHQRNLFLGFCRYLAFSHQYYFLFIFFYPNLDYTQLICTIATVYFLASCLPTFQFLDFAVKGSIAVYFFKIIGINEWIIVFITTFMWFFNVVIPVLIGSYYVLFFKTKNLE